MSFKGIVSLGAAVLIGLIAPSAQAGYVVDLTQQGGDVVATGSGAIDLTGLSLDLSGFSFLAVVGPFNGLISTGPAFPDVSTTDVYTGFTGPMSFGSGGESYPSSGSGDLVGLDNDGNVLFVPLHYVSDSPLSDTATYDGQTFSTIGVTPGRYEWTWGSGANQNFTLVVGTVVPEPSTWAMMLLGFAGLFFMGYRSAGRRRTVCNV